MRYILNTLLQIVEDSPNLLKLEAREGIEPPYADLQSAT